MADTNISEALANFFFASILAFSILNNPVCIVRYFFKLSDDITALLS